MVRTALACLLATSFLAGSAAAAPSKVVDGRVLVQLPGVEGRPALDAAIAELSADAGVPLSLERRSILDWYVLEVVAETPVKGEQLAPIVARLAESRGGHRVALDRIVRTQATFNDPLLPQQDAVGALDLPGAWEFGAGDADVVVAVVDTGAIQHEDLQGAIVGGYDFVSDPINAGDGDGRDDNPWDDGAADVDCGGQSGSSGYHGTMVSGVLAARAGNGVGVAGTAPNVKLTAVRALGACGGSSVDIAEATWWAAGGEVDGVPSNPNPAEIVNLSLGGEGACDAMYQDVFAALDEAGVIAVVAAGNEGQDSANVTPGNCAHVLTVGAVDHEGYLSSFSNYGDEVDVLAPGGDISYYGAQEAGILTTAGPGSDAYTYTQGTSFSAPFVAGIAALMVSVDAGLDRAAVESALRQSGGEALCPVNGDWVACDRPSADAAGAVGLVAGGELAVEDGGEEEEVVTDELVCDDWDLACWDEADAWDGGMGCSLGDGGAALSPAWALLLLGLVVRRRG